VLENTVHPLIPRDDIEKASVDVLQDTGVDESINDFTDWLRIPI